eukprot:gene12608-8644_t
MGAFFTSAGRLFCAIFCLFIYVLFLPPLRSIYILVQYAIHFLFVFLGFVVVLVGMTGEPQVLFQLLGWIQSICGGICFCLFFIDLIVICIIIWCWLYVFFYSLPSLQKKKRKREGFLRCPDNPRAHGVRFDKKKRKATGIQNGFLGSYQHKNANKTAEGGRESRNEKKNGLSFFVWLFVFSFSAALGLYIYIFIEWGWRRRTRRRTGVKIKPDKGIGHHPQPQTSIYSHNTLFCFSVVHLADVSVIFTIIIEGLCVCVREKEEEEEKMNLALFCCCCYCYCFFPLLWTDVKTALAESLTVVVEPIFCTEYIRGLSRVEGVLSRVDLDPSFKSSDVFELAAPSHECTYSLHRWCSLVLFVCLTGYRCCLPISVAVSLGKCGTLQRQRSTGPRRGGHSNTKKKEEEREGQRGKHHQLAQRPKKRNIDHSCLLLCLSSDIQKIVVSFISIEIKSTSSSHSLLFEVTPTPEHLFFSLDLQQSAESELQGGSSTKKDMPFFRFAPREGSNSPHNPPPFASATTVYDPPVEDEDFWEEEDVVVGIATLPTTTTTTPTGGPSTMSMHLDRIFSQLCPSGGSSPTPSTTVFSAPPLSTVVPRAPIVSIANTTTSTSTSTSHNRWRWWSRSSAASSSSPSTSQQQLRQAQEAAEEEEERRRTNAVNRSLSDIHTPTWVCLISLNSAVRATIFHPLQLALARKRILQDEKASVGSLMKAAAKGGERTLPGGKTLIDFGPGGLRGLYRGYGAAFLASLAGEATYLLALEEIKQKVVQRSEARAERKRHRALLRQQEAAAAAAAAAAAMAEAGSSGGDKEAGASRRQRLAALRDYLHLQQHLPDQQVLLQQPAVAALSTSLTGNDVYATALQEQRGQGKTEKHSEYYGHHWASAAGAMVADAVTTIFVTPIAVVVGRQMTSGVGLAAKNPYRSISGTVKVLWSLHQPKAEERIRRIAIKQGALQAGEQEAVSAAAAASYRQAVHPVRRGFWWTVYGLRGMYQGASAAMLRVPSSGVWWGTYTASKEGLYTACAPTLDRWNEDSMRCHEQGQQDVQEERKAVWKQNWLLSATDNPLLNALASAIASTITTILVNPVAVIQIRLQSLPASVVAASHEAHMQKKEHQHMLKSGTAGESNPFAPGSGSGKRPLHRLYRPRRNSFMGVAADVYHKEGVRGFFKGTTTNVSIAILDGVVFAIMFEITKLGSDFGFMSEVKKDFHERRERRAEQQREHQRAAAAEAAA